MSCLINQAVCTSADQAATEVLANYALEDLSEQITRPAITQAKSTLLDTIGVALAARTESLVKILSDTYGEDFKNGAALIWTTGLRTEVEKAALLNGAAAHALDFDDTNEAIRGHIGSTLWPTLLALGEANKTSGYELIEAYIVGVKAAVAVADGMEIDIHYAKGWHSTSTVGTLAVTCAAARLLKLTPRQTRYALGLACTMASGSRQNFGTMTKPLHAGLAAQNAILAARLAQNGFEASENALEGPLGYYALFDNRDRLEKLAHSLRDPWTPSRHGVSLKRYAVCYNLQRICDAMGAILNRSTINPKDVASIHITIEPGGTAPLITRQPQAPLECKFSAAYVVSALLYGRTLGPKSFHDQILKDSALLSIMQKVKLEERAIPPAGSTLWKEAYAVVLVKTHDGAAHSERVDNPKGHWAAPFSSAELSAKFHDCIRSEFPNAEPAALEAEIESLENIREFTGFANMPSCTSP